MRLNTEWIFTKQGMAATLVLGVLIGMQVGFFLCPMLVSCTIQQHALPEGVEFNVTNLTQSIKVD